ncbi:hypothetical protein S245_030636, partial [Arachis hypogaea]
KIEGSKNLEFQYKFCKVLLSGSYTREKELDFVQKLHQQNLKNLRKLIIKLHYSSGPLVNAFN